MTKRAAFRGGPLFSGLKPQARKLRRSQTDAEAALWRLLRASQSGVKFRRQHQFGPYILDFYCPERVLDVEVDGGQHYLPEGMTADERRDRYLAEHGVRVLRFTDLDVLQHPESIETALSEALNPHPGPLPEGEGT